MIGWVAFVDLFLVGYFSVVFVYLLMFNCFKLFLTLLFNLCHFPVFLIFLIYFYLENSVFFHEQY
jgi:hypothetical protein